MSTELPFTIQTIFNQLGGYSFGGALGCVGYLSGSLSHRCPSKDGECRANFESHFDEQRNAVQYGVGLEFLVNGKANEDWRIIVAYEPNDTYTIYLTRRVRKGTVLVREVVERLPDVYCEELQERVIGVYDDAISRYNGGFFSI